MTPIQRLPANARMSAAVIVNGIVYLKGVTPSPAAEPTIESQAADVLMQIDQILQKAGTSRERLVAVSIWLSDIGDMSGLNQVYDQWVIPGCQPVRACVQSVLAQPHYKVEIQVSAAL